MKTSTLHFGNINPIVQEEDSFGLNDNYFCVADGITRDPNEPVDFTGVSIEDFLKTYPNPSGAKFASESFCKTFLENNNTADIKEIFLNCNNVIKKLNDENIKSCDRLFNDYWGCVASGGVINNGVLNRGVVGDCGTIVYDKLGNIKFKSIDDVEPASEYYNGILKLNWMKPENRVIWRKQYRNNPNNIIDGKLYAFGALTGEENLKYFIHSGSLNIEKGDLIILYTDGFTPIIEREDFFENIYEKSNQEIESYYNQLTKEDQKKYGKEKTLINIIY